MYCPKIASILIGFFFFVPHTNIATAQILHRDTINPRNQVEIIHFGEEEDARIKHRKEPKHGILKTSPLSFLLGYTPLLYEKNLRNWLSLQVGGGVTYKPSVAADLHEFFNQLEDGQTCPGGDCNYHLDYTTRKAQTGFMLAFSPRFFLQNDGMEGSYMAPEIRFYEVRSIAEKVDPFDQSLFRTNAFDQEVIRYTDFMAQFGYQTFYPRVALDFSLGLGVRSINGNWQRIYMDEFGLNATDTPNHKLVRFRIELGFKIGFRL
jgi:hypothetical protein